MNLNVGDVIRAGSGDDEETGEVMAVDGTTITVGWDSATMTDQHIDALRPFSVLPVHAPGTIGYQDQLNERFGPA